MITIDSYKETNGQFNERKSSNSGEHHQPLITGRVNNIDFKIHDTSLGEIGQRASLTLEGYKASYDFVDTNQEETYIPSNLIREIRALNKMFGTRFKSVYELAIGEKL